MIVLGIDPGRVAGLALVQQRHGQRPLLLGCWPVRADTWARWHQHLVVVFSELCRALPPDHQASPRSAVRARPDPLKVRVVVEEPPPVARRWRQDGKGRPKLGTRLDGRLAGDSSGMRSWLGLGRRQGALMVTAMAFGWPEPELVDQGEWVAAWGVPSGKREDGRPKGQHRIAEAGLYIEGADELIAAAGHGLATAETVEALRELRGLQRALSGKDLPALKREARLWREAIGDLPAVPPEWSWPPEVSLHAMERYARRGRRSSVTTEDVQADLVDSVPISVEMAHTLLRRDRPAAAGVSAYFVSRDRSGVWVVREGCVITFLLLAPQVRERVRTFWPPRAADGGEQ